MEAVILYLAGLRIFMMEKQTNKNEWTPPQMGKVKRRFEVKTLIAMYKTMLMKKYDINYINNKHDIWLPF